MQGLGLDHKKTSRMAGNATLRERLRTSGKTLGVCIRNMRVFDSMAKHLYVPAGTWSRIKE